jgi:cysteinyl-tRNA synthetase
MIPRTFTAAVLAAAVSINCTGIDYRGEMRRFVREISAYARRKKPGFIVVPQNAHELLATNGRADGPVAGTYIRAIDGIGRESLFFGQDGSDTVTDPAGAAEVIRFLDLAKKNGLVVLVIDYCSARAKVDASYEENRARGYVSFAAAGSDLSTIPTRPKVPFARNGRDIERLGDARNFLYLINPDKIETKKEFVDTLAATDYDLLIIDLFVHGEELSVEDLALLKTKNDGGARLVLAYMSIGEAEDYRSYWDPSWSEDPPEFLGEENPEWAGNYKVRYWDDDWKSVITGSEDSYVSRIVRAGFDGVYLDLVDAYEYFEELDTALNK